jgi:hypothetical protein
VAVVALTVAHDEMQADVICGLLRENGIECSHRKTNMAGAWTIGFGTGGPTEIVVDERKLELARKLLGRAG